MFPSENPPPHGASPPGDEASLGVPSRDGLVSLSQAAEVLGYRGQELWNMLRGAGITIHRVDWDDCRGSAISLRDLFRLRQAQVPPQPGARPVGPGPGAGPGGAGGPGEAVASGGPVGPGGALGGGGSSPWGAGGAAEPAGDVDLAAFGADMERLRDLVRDAQLRNEYLSVELGQLRSQMASHGGAAARGRPEDPALQAVRDQTAETVADLRDQVRASTRALEEAAEALEAERMHNRELEKQVKDLRADLLQLSNTGRMEDLRETLAEEREKAARIQHDLERSLSLQRRSIARLEREKQALAERLAVRDEVERNNQRYIDRLEQELRSSSAPPE